MTTSMDFDFLLDTYDTERLKTLTVWTMFDDGDLEFRPERRARTPREHMVHQCVSEEGWMRQMLEVPGTQPILPAKESRAAFVRHYADASEARLAWLRERPAEWFRAEARFFEVPRSRAWILTRRITHSAHHRGQLVSYLRFLGRALYSTYGPTADTGGLPANGATVIYPYPSLAALLAAQQAAAPAVGRLPALPGAGALAPTERPMP